MKLRKLNFKSLSILFVLLFTFLQLASAQIEQVEHFHCKIRVDSTGRLHVTEQLDVQVMGQVFKRGIVRYLPLTRMGNSGKRDYRVNYTIEQILVDGIQSNFHTEQKNKSLYVYVGDADIYLEPGLYRYEISYTTEHQVAFFNDFDELYWNVTGDGWDVPIEKVTAEIEFPEGVEFIKNACVTGRYGEQEYNCESKVLSGNQLEFTSSNLSRQEGLTIIATVKPGVLIPPKNLKRDDPKEIKPPSYIERNALLISALVFSSILLIYYIITFLKFGIDPPKPTVYPQFTPPNDMSPASVGYVEFERNVPSLLTSSIVHLAIKGYLKITDDKESYLFGLINSTNYELERTEKALENDLAKEEIQLIEDLFPEGVYLRIIDGNYDPKMKDIVNQFESSMNKQWFKFITKGLHAQFWIFPIFFIFVYGLFFFGLNMMRGSMEINEFFIMPIFIGVNIILLLVYIYFIRQPTKEKLQLKSDVDGYEMYLKTADVRQLRRFNPPELTPEVFEENLPYAIALGVDKVWGKKFEKMVQSMGMEWETLTSSHFGWYGGNLDNVKNIGGFATSLNSSLTSNLSSSSTNPSSGSSSGGGGFSGGGGGGGGGGGW